jgi:uncharacterized membrane protein YedE/YeeE
MIEFISQPWHWAVSGLLIAIIMLSLLLVGKSFGISANLRTICTVCGAGKNCDFFRFNWRTQIWNLIFIAGAIIGGFVSANYLASDEAVQISDATKSKLTELGISLPEDGAQSGYLPEEIFTFKDTSNPVVWIIWIIGGFLVGFGARYAGGCTSGHAISGLSNLQLPSLIAVIGFFIGGLFVTYLIIPILF